MAKHREYPPFKGYVTKYALSGGIILATLCETGVDGMVELVRDDEYGFPVYYHGEGKDWCRTLDEAVNRADIMREAKIKSLHKQLTKLEKKDFRKEFEEVFDGEKA